MKTPYEKGWNARKEGLGTSKNPFPKGVRHPGARAWAKGWHDANREEKRLRSEDMRVVGELPPVQKAPQPEIEQAPKFTSDEQIIEYWRKRSTW